MQEHMEYVVRLHVDVMRGERKLIRITCSSFAVPAAHLLHGERHMVIDRGAKNVPLSPKSRLSNSDFGLLAAKMQMKRRDVQLANNQCR
mmetsp:Transcript_18358/g.58368  ORF Transcript_18358/g.58368 Transcript_18358/m.58368 type:complete len:89 (-) Transcript_18358:8-274(-)